MQNFIHDINDNDILAFIVSGLAGVFGFIARTIALPYKKFSIKQKTAIFLTGGLSSFCVGAGVFWILVFVFGVESHVAIAGSIVSGITGISSWLVGDIAHNLLVRKITKVLEEK